MDLTGTTVVMSFKHINMKEIPHDECHFSMWMCYERQ